MTQTQTRILELFETLPAEERAELLDRLASHGRPSVFEGLTEEQRAALDQSIAEADRGEGEMADSVVSRLASKLGL